MVEEKESRVALGVEEEKESRDERAVVVDLGSHVGPGVEVIDLPAWVKASRAAYVALDVTTEKAKASDGVREFRVSI